MRRRPAISGPLLITAGVITAIVFAVTQPSVQVPLAGEQDCGASSFEIAFGLTSRSSDDSSEIVRALVSRCVFDAQQNFVWTALALVVGVFVGIIVIGLERRQ